MRELLEVTRETVGGAKLAGAGGAGRSVVTTDALAARLADKTPKVLARRALERADVVASRGSDNRAREIDMLRTHVLQTLDARCARSLAVTGVDRGCGATFTATNLAWSMARRKDRRIVLVDADLRHPDLTARFGLKRRLGLTEFLQGKAEADEILVRIEAGGLEVFIAPASVSDAAAELLASRRMAIFLETLRRGLPDCITVLDAPALLANDDSHDLIAKVDQALLVVAAGRTPRTQIGAASNLVAGEKLLGVVLNEYR